jgi:hypothetical protein
MLAKIMKHFNKTENHTALIARQIAKEMFHCPIYWLKQGSKWPTVQRSKHTGIKSIMDYNA